MVSSLGNGRQQRLEIAKAAGEESKILVLNEPTAALMEQEVGISQDTARSSRISGTSLVYISHKLNEVFALADRVTVLRDGRSITS